MTEINDGYIINFLVNHGMSFAMNKLVDQMLSSIQTDMKYTRSMTGKEKLRDDILSTLRKVPRDEFVPEHLQSMAFDNAPLPIGHGQTISQPYIVALMTELLEIQPEHVILEIGTGSGYQSAILSCLCRQVYTIERIEELSSAAKQRFKKLHYNNIEVITGNGYYGYPQHAPYDGIIVTAAATHIPEVLVNQLKAGGKLVIPVGLTGMHQDLLLLEKDDNGETTVQNILAVAFVPLINDPELSQQN